MNQEKEIRTITNPIIIEQAPVEDEISLIDLWRTIHNHRRLAITVFMVVIFLVIGYLAMAKRYYRAEAVLLPPKIGDIHELNKIAEIRDLNKITNVYKSTDIYDGYLVNLQSSSLKMSYFDKEKRLQISSTKNKNEEHPQGPRNSNIYGEFNSQIKIIRNARKDPHHAKIQLEAPTPSLAEKWLGDLLALAERQTTRQYARAVRKEIETRIHEVQSQINIKKQMAKKLLQDQITKLRDELRIATELGIIENPLINPNEKSVKLIGIQNFPDYMKGVKALKAEISALESRKDIEPYIDGLRLLEEKLQQLKSINIDESKIKTVRIDQKPRAGTAPSKPKYKMIISVGGVLAFLLALLSTFIAEFVRRFRETLAAEDT